MESGNGENKVAAYINSRGIQDKIRIQQAWLGIQAGLGEDELDLFCKGEYFPKQRDYIRIALEEGMPLEKVKENLCHYNLAPRDILKRKREYFLQLDTQPISVLISQVGNQMKENSRLAEFIMGEQGKTIKIQKEDTEELRKTMGQELHRLNEKISQMELDRQRIQLSSNQGKDFKKIESNLRGFLEKTIRKYHKKKRYSENSEIQKEDIFDLISNPEFTPAQMQEILSGFQDGLELVQIKRYAKPEYSAEKMRELRNCLNLMLGNSNNNVT